MIKISGLTKKYRELLALDRLDLTIHPGEIVGLLGPNGAGKTTTIKLLCGLLKPTAGSAKICGIDIVKNPIEAKRKIGLVPDHPVVYPKLTGTEFLELSSKLYSVDSEAALKRRREYIDLFEMTEHADKLIENYSRGMQQKLVVISILQRDPEAILLDEPMVGLDPKSARHIKEILSGLAGRGRAIFLSTHALEIAEQLCHRIAILMKGRLVYLGTRKELEHSASMPGSPLEEVFLKLTEEETEK